MQQQERHPWKGNLIVQIDIPQVEDFLIGLQKSCKEQATKVMEEA